MTRPTTPIERLAIRAVKSVNLREKQQLAPYINGLREDETTDIQMESVWHYVGLFQHQIKDRTLHAIARNKGERKGRR